MLKFYGRQPGNVDLSQLRIGGLCPHCREGSRFTRITDPKIELLQQENLSSFSLAYVCDLCEGLITVEHRFEGWRSQEPVIRESRLVTPSRAEFDFSHVPEEVRKDVEEALACLSVYAFHGFAALCRRAVQAICTNLGAKASSRVRKQIKEMLELSDLDEEWESLATQIMLTGHDGSHPNLPEVDQDRAQVLLALLQDLSYELYTRPGKIKEAASLRAKALEQGG